MERWFNFDQLEPGGLKSRNSYPIILIILITFHQKKNESDKFSTQEIKWTTEFLMTSLDKTYTTPVSSCDDLVINLLLISLYIYYEGVDFWKKGFAGID